MRFPILAVGTTLATFWAQLQRSVALAQGPAECGLTNRWSGRVKDKVPSSNVGARAAQLNR